MYAEVGADDLFVAAAAASRHLMFSSPKATGEDAQRTPNAARRRRSTERGDSQDELISVLDQMEQKYASPDVTMPVTRTRPTSPRRNQQQRQRHHNEPPPPPATAMEDVNLTPTPAASYSSTGTLSPQSLRTQEPLRTQDVTRHQAGIQALEAIKEQEALEQEVSKTPPQPPPVVEADSFDDLTEESWALVDQLQSQRAPVEATQSPSQSQTELVSSQSFALTPRPMPSMVYADQKKSSLLPPSKAPASVVRTSPTVGTVQRLESPEGFKRFLVLELDRDVVNRSLLLRLLDDQDVQLEAVLSDDWYDVLVEAGDTINIVFTEQDKDGFFSQDKNDRVVSHSSRILVDNAHNIVIVHPDILVRL
ncbi:unnamed protein product [Phytophthora lilii]|uniref:Unnamed protein product n=1 Tax=Phytophthora lilii TaxID=2077276 RepID=A0A9W6TIU6_9STRA|nr:unnamed protein product [Phytophthora lilii]